MATRRWRGGGAAAVSQIQTFAFGGTWEVGDLIRVTMGARTWDYAVTSTTITTFLPLFVTAFNALSTTTYPEFSEITASSNSTTLTFTGDTAGLPFTVTLTPLESNAASADAQTIEGGGSATTGTTATAATGPYHWDAAANWQEGVVPTTGDAVIVDGGGSILYGFPTSPDTFASFRIGPNYSAQNDIGLADNSNPSNPGSGYPQYRSRRLKLAATLAVVDTVSGRVRLDFHTVQTAITVNGTGTARGTGEPPLDIVAVNSNNVLRVNRGTVWVAGFAGDVSTFSEIDVAYRETQASDATVYIGPGVTLTTLLQSGGQVTLEAAVTTVERTGGTLTRIGSGAVTTLHNNGGVVYDESSGTITTVRQNAELHRRGLATCTYTTLYLYAQSVTTDLNGVLTLTNPVEFTKSHPAGPAGDAGPRPVWFNFGFDRKATIVDI